MDELIAQCEGGLVRKEEAVRVIVKARSYLRTHQQMEAMLDQVADEAGVSQPSKSILMPLMTKLMESHANIPELNEDDVREIWDVCDTNGDGHVSRAELLLALATWRDNLVRIYSKDEADAAPAPSQSGSSMCVLL